MLAKYLSRLVPEKNMNHIYVLFLLGNTLVNTFSSENTKKKKKAIWSPPGFRESAGPGSGGRCGRKIVAGRRAGCSPWSQAAGFVHRSVLLCYREPQLAEKSRFSLNMTPFTLWKLQASLGYIPAPGQQIICKLTHAACFGRGGAQHASRLWEEVLLQRVMDGGNLGCHCGPLI